ARRFPGMTFAESFPALSLRLAQNAHCLRQNRNQLLLFFRIDILPISYPKHSHCLIAAVNRHPQEIMQGHGSRWRIHSAETLPGLVEEERPSGSDNMLEKAVERRK